MGTTQSSSSNDNNCVLKNADMRQTMLHKLKSHFCQLRKDFQEKQQQTDKVKSRKKKLRVKILPPMPRCSSYIALDSIGTTGRTKKSKSKKVTSSKDIKIDKDYNPWKIDFEAVRPHARTIRKDFGKLPEALAGQITPEGFPAYTIIEKAVVPKTKPTTTNPTTVTKATVTTQTEEQPAPAKGQRTKSMRSTHKNDDKNDAIAAISQSLNTTYTVHHRLSFRLPLLFNGDSNKSKAEKQDKNKSVAKNSNESKIISNSRHNLRMPEMQQQQQQQQEPPQFLSKMSKERANVIAKFYQDMKDIEDYYGTRVNYYYL